MKAQKDLLETLTEENSQAKNIDVSDTDRATYAFEQVREEVLGDWEMSEIFILSYLHGYLLAPPLRILP